MANIDLTPFTTSSQIFTTPSHTLPQIRQIHKALHAQLEDTASRLRTQVGNSYRDLLGTADTIVAMRDDMERVQGTLGGMGGRCGRAVVGRKVGGLGRFVEEMEEGDGERGREARRGLLVLGARLWVLGRLLVKSLGGEGEEVRGAEKSLEGLHRRLLRGVEGVLRRGRERGDVLMALGAYSLATSSGASDVLRHFLRVRGQAMALAFEDAGEERKDGRGQRDVLRCLGLYTRTLQDVQSLVPNRLTEALMALKKDALLANESLKTMEGLRLDIYKRWCGDEIQYYTPFIRHDDLDGKQAREMLTSWAKEGSGVLLRGLEKTLDGMTEFKAIVELRTNVLKLWIQEGSKAKGFDPSVLLDQIRDSVNGHMLEVVEAKVAKLRLVGSEVSAALDAWREGFTERHKSLWDDGSFDTELSSGAAQFTQDVVARLYGRNDAVSKAVTCYQSWYHVIDDVTVVVDQLQRQRWDNDVDEIEDEETIEHRQKLLAKEDPQKLSEHLNVSLVKAFNRLEEHLVLLWKAHQDGPNKGPIAMYFLRVLRDIRARLPQNLDAVKEFGLDAVPSLHETVAASVLALPLGELATVALARMTVVGRSLWEGSPELPASPSPGIFRVLRNLSTSMGDAGGDLWSPTAVKVLKQQLQREVSKRWLEAVEAVNATESPATAETKDNEGDAAGDKEEPSTEPGAKSDDDKTAEQRRDLFIQWLFDISYLRAFLEASSEKQHSLKDAEDAIFKHTKLDVAARDRVAKTTQDYWKRTSLLFGLLS
ncbi:oligomeric Golgi complex subunit 1 [Podospora aff. communis PSN243]|uniref:Conserved oligomeric Golgi complex subunit 1 n=1 Tax=Podospora aff. communis PSN243 TaxID=3040156 RepID=A0AAV9G9N9_9PEZI|nr:oligomeric Golgi complex subunit 1 [Podospora aff. communis PSN243]